MFFYLFIHSSSALLFITIIKKSITKRKLICFSCTILGLILLIQIIPNSIQTYLFVLWWMSCSLSVTDCLYLTVEPALLYPLTLIASYYYFQVNQVSILSFIIPALTFSLFLILEVFLPHSIGGGDIKLIIIYSFFLPTIQLLYLILFSSFLGILFIIIIYLIFHKKIERLPFVPFLTISLLCTFFYFK